MNLHGNLRHLNSMTKYPSIDTYHRLDPKNGKLLDEATQFSGEVLVTEKIDGTNARIIVFPDGDWIIGSREELLCAKLDRIPNPALGIVAALHDTAEHIAENHHGHMKVYYGEVYGAGVGKNGKQYTHQGGEVGFRLFDVANFNGFEELLGWPIEKVAAWRDGGGQPFSPWYGLESTADELGITRVPLLRVTTGPELPAEIDKMHAYLGEQLPHTWANLGNAATGKAEGLVLRSLDRSVIAKARFEDYERTLRKR